MYSIYSKVGDYRVCLHDDTVSSDQVKVIEPVLTLEDNSAGSLTFKLAPNNQSYNTHTFYDDMVTGFSTTATSDISDDLETGSIDDNGEEIVDPSCVRTSDFLTINGVVSSFDISITSSTGEIDLTNLIHDGSTSDQTDSTRLHTDKIAYDGADTHTVSATAESLYSDITDSFTDGVIGDAESTLYDTTRISSSMFEATTASQSYAYADICIHVDEPTPEWKGQFIAYGYHKNNEGNYTFIGKSEWKDLDTSFRFNPVLSTQQGPVFMTHYRLMIREKDDSAILSSQFSEIVNEVKRSLMWKMFFYNQNDEVIDQTGFINSGVNSTKEVDGCTNYAIELKYAENEEISSSDILTAVVKPVDSLMWAIYGYKTDGTFVGKLDFISVSRDQQLTISGFQKIKAAIKYETGMTLSPSDISSASISFKNFTITKVPKEIDMVARMKSTITVYRKEWYIVNEDTGEKRLRDVELWEGRVLTEDKDFWNNRTIYCEGELSYLNDTCQPQREYGDVTLRQFLEAVLNYHNSRVPDAKKFYVGQVWVNDSSGNTNRYTQYEKTMEVLNKLISDYGGHIKIRKTNGKRYLDWFDDYGEDGNPVQTINFGVNLLDFTCNWDMTELCTVLLPTGHITQQASSTSAGDPLVLNNGYGPTPNQLLYQDSSTKEVFISASPTLAGYKTAVAVVEPEKNYYFSGRLHGGLVAYTIKSNADGSGDYYEGGTKTAGTEGQVGFVDFVDQKITIPAGAHSVVMCSFGDDIPLTLKSEIPAVEGLDTYLTIEECAYDEGWHQQGSLYIVNQEAVEQFGWIEKQLALEEIEDKDLLYQTAKNYLQSGQFDKMTIELSAVDMNLLGAQTEHINLLDQVRVLSAPHGLDRYFPVTKLEIPLDKPAEQKFTLGEETSQSLTSVNNDINSDLLARIAGMPSMSATLQSAKANAAEMINNALNGYITMKMNESDGHPEEIIISDRQNYNDPNAKVWRWNSAGLAYSSKGYDLNEFNTNVAITADGQIVANMIKAGILNGVQIQGCEITAGGIDNSDGTIIVKNGSSATHALRLSNASVEFGNLTGSSSSSFTAHSDIKGDVTYEGGLHGIRIKTPVLAFDADHWWISSGQTSQDAEVGQEVNFTFSTTEGNKRLYFRHGVLIRVE